MTDIRIRRVTLEHHECGCVLGMDEDGNVSEYPDAPAAVHAIKLRDTRAAGRGESTATVLVWCNPPAGFVPPVPEGTR